MKVKRSQIEALSNLILKEISTSIREIIREEFDIEAKRLKKQLFEMKSNEESILKTKTVVQKRVVQKPHIIKQKTARLIEKSKKIDTGSDYINEILDEIPVEKPLREDEIIPSTVFDESDFSAPAKIDFHPTTSFNEATKQSINETRRMNSGKEVYKPGPGEAINFDPNTMDPTKIDWGEFVDEVDKRAKDKHF